MARTVVRAKEHDRARSLGHLAVAWMEFFVRHGPGDVQGQPVVHGQEYYDFIVDCYAVSEQGRLLYDSAFLSRPKGCDKSGLGARLALFEAFGPCRVLRDADGEPVFAEGGEVYRDPWGLGFVHEYVPGEPMGAPVKVPFIRCMATEEGQPLALDTPVATPSGWTTVGAITPGDEVFGSDGAPVVVSRVTEVFHDLDCYEVTFSDGEVITASGSHCWTVEKRRLGDGKHRRMTVTTEDMAVDYWHRTRGNVYRIPVTPALDLPDADLPVDPYFLGLWLGDGKTADSAVCFDRHDEADMRREIGRLLEPGETAVWSGTETCGDVRIKRVHGRRDLNTMRNRLREVGVIGRKHIPAAYLRASHAQRFALLQGLMDSDGTIDAAKGRAVFVNTNRDLVDGVEELLTSLGYKWDERHTAATRSWRVAFQPTSDAPPFRIARKVARCRPSTARAYSRYRHVVRVERVPSVPVRCIGIDTADHLFAAGRRMVLTHNTGNVYDTIHFNLTDQDCPLSAVLGRRDDAGLTRILIPGGGEITPSTSSSASKDGGKETFVVFDETHLYTRPDLRRMYATVVRNLRKRKKIAGTWFLETTTMYAPGEASVAEETYKVARLIETGKTKRERLLLDHQYGPIAVEDIGDEAKLRQALTESYGDALAWNDLDGMVDGILDSRSEVADSIRYFLNDESTAETAWLAGYEWAARADASKVVAAKDVVTLGFDGSRSRQRGTADATALVGCRVEDGHVFELEVWEQPKGATGKGWEVPLEEVLAAVRGAFERFTVVGFYADPARWESHVAVWERDYGTTLKVKASREHPIEWWMTGNRRRQTAEALEKFHGAVLDGEMTHDGSSTLTRHVLAARRVSGGQIAKDSPESERKIDAAVAAVLAWQARLDALAKGAGSAPRTYVPRRIR